MFFAVLVDTCEEPLLMIDGSTAESSDCYKNPDQKPLNPITLAQ